MIRSTGVFFDTRRLTAMFVVKYQERMKEGILQLRDLDEEGECHDLPIVKEWKAARAILSQYRSATPAFFSGQTAELGKAWIESIPAMVGSPWLVEDDDYAQSVVRTRCSLISVPNGYSYSGDDKVLLGVGVVNFIEHRSLCSETNPSQFSRIHLIVDVKRPDEQPPEEE